MRHGNYWRGQGKRPQGHGVNLRYPPFPCHFGNSIVPFALAVGKRIPPVVTKYYN